MFKTYKNQIYFIQDKTQVIKKYEVILYKIYYKNHKNH
jgi:hypothetical protein